VNPTLAVQPGAWERGLRRVRFWFAEGMTPEAMALGVALGFVLGVFPAFGFPTLLCVLAAVSLRLNPAVLQTVNYLVYPLQIALLVPFIRCGELLFGTPAALRGGGVKLFWSVAATMLHAVGAWFCIGLPAGVLLYYALAGLLRRYGMGRLQSSEELQSLR
jgi:uncharacterized protein (DUF2062 family)